MNKTTAAVILGGFLLALAGWRFFTLQESEVSVGSWTLPAATSSASVVALSSNPPEGFVEFQNEKYGFSLFYPPTLEVTEYDEEGGAHTVSFEDKSGEKGFQIFITPYTEDQITQDRFRMDVPSGVMKEPTDIVIDGIRATMFFSENALMGETREVWFIHDGYLHEVTTYKELNLWLAEIMRTWKW
ncbi:MAG: hypothetical protein G01um101456_191 [Parcubacteria group bacterium Gr01-1014_56]|nr:MAG: hypothetical protein G01um101456_191 [Parcubacteria group bacterium Gr01-1014_56]